MSKEEKIILVLVALALVGVVVFKFSPGFAATVTGETISTHPDPQIVGLSVTPDTSDPDSGPMYLKAQQPYLFGPPVIMISPPVTEGQIGESDLKTAENDMWPRNLWGQTIQ